jgi:hypothetical protein
MQYLSCWGLNRYVHDVATGASFYSCQGIVVDKIMKSKLLIRHKHGKEIYVIKRFVINVLWKEIISYLYIHAGAKLDVGGKSIIFSSIIF